MVETSTFPIVCTVTNAYDQKMSALRKASVPIEFVALKTEEVFEILTDISNKEKIDVDESALKSLARRSGGDLRGAIIDLQTITANGDKLTNETLDLLGDRKQTSSMMKALQKVFKLNDQEIVLRAFDDVDEDMDQVFLWLDENLPLEYTGKELEKAYWRMSKADVFRGRIMRWQHWRFMAYIYQLLSAGVAFSKEEKKTGFTKYQPTKRLLKYWMANMKYQKRKSIAAKIAPKIHASQKETIKNMHYIKIMMHHKQNAKLMAHEFGLNEDEIKWLQ